jgi:hypothetical protein
MKLQFTVFLKMDETRKRQIRNKERDVSSFVMRMENKRFIHKRICKSKERINILF